MCEYTLTHECTLCICVRFYFVCVCVCIPAISYPLRGLGSSGIPVAKKLSDRSICWFIRNLAIQQPQKFQICKITYYLPMLNLCAKLNYDKVNRNMRNHFTSFIRQWIPAQEVLSVEATTCTRIMDLLPPGLEAQDHVRSYSFPWDRIVGNCRKLIQSHSLDSLFRAEGYNLFSLWVKKELMGLHWHTTHHD